MFAFTRKTQATPAESRRKRRALHLETLEHRRVLAELALGIEFFADVNNQAGDSLNVPVESGQAFWVGIVVQDQRAVGGTSPGVISLPLNVDWDPNMISLSDPTTDAIPGAMGPISPDNVDALLLTERFPVNRLLVSYDPAAPALPDDATGLSPAEIDAAFNLRGLQGAASPSLQVGQAIGQNAPPVRPTSAQQLEPQLFSLFRMRALSPVDPTAITLQLAGAAAVADADVISNVVPLAGYRTADVPEIPNAVRAEFSIAPVPTDANAKIEGHVFVDTNYDGQFDTQEFGLPTVMLTLLSVDGQEVATTETGADGEYRFDNLAPGTYRVVESQPTGFADASISAGTLEGTMNPAGTAVGLNEVAMIVLEQGQSAIDVNFGERLADVTKRMFLASTDPRIEFCDILDAQCGLISGTDQNDTALIVRSSQGVSIQINAQAPIEVPVGLLDTLMLDLGAGDDTVIFEDQTADAMMPDQFVFVDSQRGYEGLLRHPAAGEAGQIAVGVFGV